MKLAILSDIHANLEALRATLRDVSAQAVDRIACLGDIVGYNANPNECVALVRELDPLCVAGNHDRAVAGLITTQGFDATAARAVAWTRKRLAVDALCFLARLPLLASIEDHLVAVHGALGPEGGCEMTYVYNDERRRRSLAALIQHPSGARILAHGHTHRLGVFEYREGRVRACPGDEVHLRDDAHYLINPGTVGQPRGTSDRRATYLVLDTDRQVVTVRRVRYDRSVPLAKTREAGLAPRSTITPAAVPAALRVPLVRGLRRSGLYGFVRGMARPGRPVAGSHRDGGGKNSSILDRIAGSGFLARIRKLVGAARQE